MFRLNTKPMLHMKVQQKGAIWNLLSSALKERWAATQDPYQL